MSLLLESSKKPDGTISVNNICGCDNAVIVWQGKLVSIINVCTSYKHIN